MKEFVHDVWGILLLRGIALLLFGITAVVWPGVTFVSLALLFAIYVLVAGIADIVVAVRASHRHTRFVTLLLGIIEVAVGIYMLINPTMALTTFILVVGFTFMFQGIFVLIASFVDTKDAGIKLLEIVGSVLSIIVGFIVLNSPIAGGIAFTWTLGIYGIIAGTVSIASALSVRHVSEKVEKILSPHKVIARG